MELLSAIEIAEFNPVTATLGGAILGFAALILLLVRGDVAGINGMLVGLLSPQKNEFGWRLSFILGLVTSGFLYKFLNGDLPNLKTTVDPSLVMVAGLLVGIGVTFARGCTSGHGICGISRFSTRSLAATITFILSGMITVYLMNHL